MVPIAPRRAGSTALESAPPSAPLHGAGETHVGHVRRANQDVIVVEPDLGLYAVLDGMGGANAGDVAARLASEVIVDHVRKEARAPRHPPGRVLRDALLTASAAVFVVGEKMEQCEGMGTTAVVCLVADPTHVVIAHLGDSRAYLLRGGVLSQRTSDHTVAQELVDQGELKARSARRRREAHMLTRCVGGGGRPDVQELTVKPGDRLLLCSDGLYGYTPLRSIRRVLAGDGTAEQLAHELVELALRGAAPDNVAAVAITVAGGHVRAGRARRART